MNQSINTSDDAYPIMTTLSEACIHAARYSMKICLEEWTSGLSASFGYAFPVFIFSSALVLIISTILPVGSPNDMMSVETAADMLRILSASHNLAAKDLHGHLQRVRQCLHHYQSSSKTQDCETVINHNGTQLHDHTVSIPPQGYNDAPVPEASLNLPSFTGSSEVELSSSTLTTEMALHSSLMQEFLNQSTFDGVSLDLPEFPNDFDAAFLWPTDALCTE